MTALGAAGDNLVLKIGSYIPFISTFFMPFRAINGYANGLEAWISLAITIAFAVTATIFIGRMYASLVLQTDDLGHGKPLNVPYLINRRASRKRVLEIKRVEFRKIFFISIDF